MLRKQLHIKTDCFSSPMVNDSNGGACYADE